MSQPIYVNIQGSHQPGDKAAPTVLFSNDVPWPAGTVPQQPITFIIPKIGEYTDISVTIAPKS